MFTGVLFAWFTVALFCGACVLAHEKINTVASVAFIWPHARQVPQTKTLVRARIKNYLTWWRARYSPPMAVPGTQWANDYP